MVMDCMYNFGSRKYEGGCDGARGREKCAFTCRSAKFVVLRGNGFLYWNFDGFWNFLDSL